MDLMKALRSHAKITHQKIEQTDLFSHNLTKGEVRERVLRDFLRPFLPACYGLGTGQVFSAKNQESKQIDIVIYDAVFSIVMQLDDTKLIFPCESVFGNIEVKSNMKSEKDLESAIENIRSLKSLEREKSIAVDITPIYRLLMGEGFEVDDKKRNPYLGVVFALDGMDGEKVRDRLLKYPSEERETLPNYIFNLKKQYMVSRWKWKLDKSGYYIKCEIGEYDGFVCDYLGDDLLPMLYLVLTTVLNSIRLKQSDVTEKVLIDRVRKFQGKPIPWKDERQKDKNQIE